MEKNTFGTFLAALRKANGMTQKDLAEKLNVSDKSVSRWERDENYPDLMLLPVIADIFNVTTDELLRGTRSSAQKNEVSGKEAETSEEKTAEKLAADTKRAEKQLKVIVKNQGLKWWKNCLISFAIFAACGVLALIFTDVQDKLPKVARAALSILFYGLTICSGVYLIACPIIETIKLYIFVGDYSDTSEDITKIKSRFFNITWIFETILVTIAAVIGIDNLYGRNIWFLNDVSYEVYHTASALIPLALSFLIYSITKKNKAGRKVAIIELVLAILLFAFSNYIPNDNLYISLAHKTKFDTFAEFQDYIGSNPNPHVPYNSYAYIGNNTSYEVEYLLNNIDYTDEPNAEVSPYDSDYVISYYCKYAFMNTSTGEVFDTFTINNEDVSFILFTEKNGEIKAATVTGASYSFSLHLVVVCYIGIELILLAAMIAIAIVYIRKNRKNK